MAQTVLITLTTAGSDTGPFDLYTNVDGYTVPFENNVPKLALESGYLASTVPDAATTIRVKSDNPTCSNYTDLSIITTTTTTSSTSTTTTTTSTSTTTSTTTAAPVALIEISNPGSSTGLINTAGVNGVTVTYVSGTNFPITIGQSGIFSTTEIGTYSISVNYSTSDSDKKITVTDSALSTQCQNAPVGAGLNLDYFTCVVNTSNNVQIIFEDGNC